MINSFKNYLLHRLGIIFPFISIFCFISYFSSYFSFEFQEKYPLLFLFVDLFVHWQIIYIFIACIYLFIFFRKEKLKSFIYFSLVFIPFIFGIIQNQKHNNNFKEEITLKIISANIHVDANDLGNIISFIDNKDPDIIYLMETTTNIKPAINDLILKKNYDVFSDFNNYQFGFVVLSKKNIHLKNTTSLKMPENIPLFLGAKDNKTIYINFAHVMPPVSEYAKELRNRAFSDAIIALNQQLIQKPDFLLLVGDLNSTIWSTPLHLLNNIGFYSTTSFNPTWPNFLFGFLGIGIDHVIIPEFNNVVEKEVFNLSNNSDHLGIYVELSSKK